MYRRGFFLLGLLVLLIAVWHGTKDFTVRTGTIFSSRGFRYHTCGSSAGIEFFDEYAPGIEGSFLKRRCDEAARQRTATQGFIVFFALGLFGAGVARGPAPPLQSIDVLTPLPTPADMRRSRMRVIRDVDDIR